MKVSAWAPALMKLEIRVQRSLLEADQIVLCIANYEPTITYRKLSKSYVPYWRQNNVCYGRL